MIKKIAFTLYPVKDMKRARAFYENDLGLKPTENYHDDWIEYDLAGGCFAITKIAEGMSPSATSGGSISFEVSDVDQLTRKLKEKGYQVKMEPFSSPVCRMSVVIDSEGNAVGLHQVTD